MGKGKGTNNAAGKSQLVKSMKEAFKRVEQSRWLETEEGKAWMLEEERKREMAEMKKMLVVGQLVWREDIQDDPTLTTSGTIANRCHKITKINEEDVEIEMLFVMIGGNRVDTYTSWCDQIWTKGDKITIHFYRLERHISKKSTNVWWKIK
jgi:hypothetical protein